MSLFAAQRFRIPISLARRAILLRDKAVMAAHTQHIRSATTAPLAAGIPFQTITIPHNNRTLEAVYITPAAPSAAILLFHGIGDQLHYWESAQRLLAEHNIASLLFHYSGFGQSTGATTPGNLHQDSHAAYATLRSLLPAATPIYLLGFSLGTGIATEAAPHLSPPPAGLILCQAFTSLRAAAAAIASPAIAPLLPAIWNTQHAIAALQLPRLIVHGDADQLFPTAMAHQIAASAQNGSSHPISLSLPVGFAHSDPYLRAVLSYWQPIIDFASSGDLTSSGFTDGDFTKSPPATAPAS